MKKKLEEITKRKSKLSKFKSFLGIGLDKLRNGSVKCPFCRDVFNGMRELGLHIKDAHCR